MSWGSTATSGKSAGAAVPRVNSKLTVTEKKSTLKWPLPLITHGVGPVTSRSRLIERASIPTIFTLTRP